VTIVDKAAAPLMRALLNAASVPVHASGTPHRSIGDLFSWLALLALATLAALARRSRAHRAPAQSSSAGSQVRAGQHDQMPRTITPNRS
jgi:MYXO-CTERM domain-containing protein